MFLSSAYYKGNKNITGWVKPCVICGEKSRYRLILKYDDVGGKRTICAQKMECIKKIFPDYKEFEDDIIKFGKFRRLRDKGLECSKCKSLMFDGIIVLTKSSSIQINKYKLGCCEKCLEEVIDGDQALR